VATGPNARYLHMTADDAKVVLTGEARAPVHVAEAAGWIDQFSRSTDGIRFRLSSYTRVSLRLASASGCRVLIDGLETTAVTRKADIIDVEFPAHEVGTTPRRVPVDVRCG
jgi:hypothetical protein